PQPGQPASPFGRRSLISAHTSQIFFLPPFCSARWRVLDGGFGGGGGGGGRGTSSRTSGSSWGSCGHGWGVWGAGSTQASVRASGATALPSLISSISIALKGRWSCTQRGRRLANGNTNCVPLRIRCLSLRILGFL